MISIWLLDQLSYHAQRMSQTELLWVLWSRYRTSWCISLFLTQGQLLPTQSFSQGQRNLLSHYPGECGSSPGGGELSWREDTCPILCLSVLSTKLHTNGYFPQLSLYLKYTYLSWHGSPTSHLPLFYFYSRVCAFYSYISSWKYDCVLFTTVFPVPNTMPGT